MQPAQEQFLPRITQHIDDEIVHFADGRIGLVLKLDGTLFEGINDRIIINQYLNLNTVFSELGKGVEGRLGLWLTLHRRRINFEREMKFHNVFAKQFAKKYMQRFEQGEYFENTYYIAVVLKYTDIDEGKIELHRIKSRLLAGMATYSPEVLSVYFLHNDEKKIKLNEIPDEDEQINEDEEIIRPTEDDILFSEVYEFVGLLANGVQQRIPLSNKDAYTTIAVSDLHFGNEIVEIRCPNQTKFAALYDLKDFGKSKMKALNPLLNLDCEFIFTQSFVYIGKTKAAEKIKAQLNRMEDTGEVFGDEQQDLIDAQNYLSSGSVMFGDYHAALTVYGETAKSADRNSQKVVSAFQGCGAFIWKQANVSAPQSYYSHIFGHKGMPRPFLKSTTNIATSFGMFNYSHGKRHGNPLGDGTSVMPLLTVAGTSYDFNFHFTKEDEDSRGKKIAGHTLILGATGTGKTTLQTALLTFTERFNPYIFALDLDRGMEIWIRAMGGEYFAIETGKPTGLNPFQLPDSEENRSFLYDLVALCGKNEQGTVSAREQEQIKQAVDTLMRVQWEKRNFSNLFACIQDDFTDDNSLKTRLRKWCRDTNGQFAWVLDNETNKFNPDTFYRIGIDLTAILKKDYEPCLPTMMYLFKLKDMLMVRVKQEDGLLATVFEEFWYALKHPVTAEFLVKILKTDRKLGGFAVLVTQSPKDAINSENFATIVEQTPTKILLPNPDAIYEGNYELVGLTLKQYEEIVKLDLASRTFAIKQGRQWSMAKLDLYGFNDEIAVLSGTSANLVKMQEAIAETDNNPEHWLPVFNKKTRKRSS
ncbi:MAG: conjugal transfer protein [Neisseriaceae bacterium]|nr:conjugal transfer protein [Neisseriaceae bacterium]